MSFLLLAKGIALTKSLFKITRKTEKRIRWSSKT